jgi:hypothetical protein
MDRACGCTKNSHEEKTVSDENLGTYRLHPRNVQNNLATPCPEHQIGATYQRCVWVWANQTPPNQMLETVVPMATFRWRRQYNQCDLRAKGTTMQCIIIMDESVDEGCVPYGKKSHDPIQKQPKKVATHVPHS